MIGSTVNVTTGATVIYSSEQKGNVSYPTSLVIKNPSGGQTVFLGGSSVDATGYSLEAGDILSIDMVNDTLYGVVAATSQDIRVLRRGT